jgi:transposase-like protein
VLVPRPPLHVPLSIWAARDDAERERILAALAQTAGNRTQAARRLGMSRQSLHDRLRRYGIGAGAGRPGHPLLPRGPAPPLDSGVGDGE